MKIICIEGCTASGKSDLALLLAKELQTEIISADSRQVYKLLDIGTAKPNKQTLSEVSHHLIDILTPDQRYSAGNFVKDARNIIQSLHKQSKVAILCGGTMLYFKCLLEGLSDIPDIDKEAMQKADEYMSSHSLPDCYEYVKSFDPKFASTILPTDKQRIHRALCVWFAFEKPITSFWETEVYLPVFTPLKILLNRDRETIYQRINTRTAAMVSA
ncbi:MAG: tRNA (adenosine(37)-N6)-dimethylallyltransferase MiaA, partial [Candidatus Cloacimonetes bacterium]|nr:tRNA (adenosine(37)-N6)-dimethylallyltransferase MiaA [Candidatus Cloacimonadota bacterium]